MPTPWPYATLLGGPGSSRCPQLCTRGTLDCSRVSASHYKWSPSPPSLARACLAQSFLPHCNPCKYACFWYRFYVLATTLTQLKSSTHMNCVGNHDATFPTCHRAWFNKEKARKAIECRSSGCSVSSQIFYMKLFLFNIDVDTSVMCLDRV